MKKFFIVLLTMLCFSIIFSNLNVLYADEDISVLINKQIKVLYDEQIFSFQDANGTQVFPISYQGTTYLPVRAISSLFQTSIKWDSATNSIYLGEGEKDTNSAKVNNQFKEGQSETVTALLNQNIKIYFNNQLQSFKDVNKNTVYPISYNGTTYLPVRSISNIFNLNIAWDSYTQSVLITSNNNFPYVKPDIPDTRIPEVSTEDFESVAQSHITNNAYINDIGIWQRYSARTKTSSRYANIYLKLRKMYTSEAAEIIVSDYNNIINNLNILHKPSIYKKKNKDYNLNAVLFDIDLKNFKLGSPGFTPSNLQKNYLVQINFFDLKDDTIGATYGKILPFNINNNYDVYTEAKNQMLIVFETPKEMNIAGFQIHFFNEIESDKATDITYENFFISNK